jgi:hypothetical protein
MRSRFCLCVCIPHIVRQRRGKNPLIVARQQLCKNPLIVVRQRLGRNITAETNTHNRRIVGRIVFSMVRVV